MANRVKFICQKFPELCLVMEPASFEVSTSGRSKNVKGSRIEFKRNPYGVGEFVTSDEKAIAHIKDHELYKRGTIVVAESESDPRSKAPVNKPVELNQGLRASKPTPEAEQPPAETPRAARPARVPPKKKPVTA